MGYLLIDHSGGIGPDGKRGIKQEYDTRQCPHCGGIVKIYVKRHLLFKEQGTPDEGFFCMQCMAPICEYCAKTPECIPFMTKLVERMRRIEAQRQLLAALSLK